MINLLTNNNFYRPVQNKKNTGIAFKSNHVEETYNRARKLVLAPVPQREYEDRKQYILDCMEGKKELDARKFLENPDDRKKNLVILNDVIGEHLQDYIGAMKRQDRASLADDNNKLNKNLLNSVNFWQNTITSEDKNKYIYSKGEDSCQKLYGLSEEEWIYVTYDFLHRKSGQMENLYDDRHDLDYLEYLNEE